MTSVQRPFCQHIALVFISAVLAANSVYGGFRTGQRLTTAFKRYRLG